MGRQPFGIASAAAWLRARRLERDAGRRRQGAARRRHARVRRTDRVSPADAHGHASGRAGHRARSPRESVRPPVRVRPVRAAQRRLVGVARRGRLCSAASSRPTSPPLPARWRTRMRRRMSAFGRRSHLHSAGRSAPARCRGCSSSCPTVPGCRRSRNTRRSRCRAARVGRWATPRRAAAAAICAATVPSCRSTRGSSASCRPRSCWPTSPRRSRRVPATSRSAIRISSTGPTHALRLVEALHAAHPAVSYDVTIKVEHLLQHRDLLPRLAATGCAFVVSAVESIDDRVLALLDKGHTRADFVEAVGLCRARRPDAGADLRGVSPVAHAGRVLRPPGHHREPRPRRTRGADSARHPAAHSAGVAAARPGRDAAARRPVRPGDADASLVAPGLPRGRSPARGHGHRRHAADRPTGAPSSSRFARSRTNGRGMPRVAEQPRPARDRATVPYLNEPWYC